MSEQVKHPQHYGGEENHYEAIKVIEAWNLNFCLGNVVKYVSRAGKKDPKKYLEDLEKASWYLTREINKLKASIPEMKEKQQEELKDNPGLLDLLTGLIPERESKDPSLYVQNFKKSERCLKCQKNKIIKEAEAVEQKAPFLLLDNTRTPKDVFEYTGKAIYVDKKWDVVRSFDEFKKYIKTNGIPELISFEYDLDGNNYPSEDLFDRHDELKERMRQQAIRGEGTGYDCAVWLICFCTINKLKLPIYYCHSKNPLGKASIIKLLKAFGD